MAYYGGGAASHEVLQGRNKMEVIVVIRMPLKLQFRKSIFLWEADERAEWIEGAVTAKRT